MPNNNLVEVAAAADQDRIVELAWNSEKRQPDFIVYDRSKREVTRAESVDMLSGTICVPSCWRNVVAPDCAVPGSVFVPTECDRSRSDGDELRADIRGFIDRYVELPAQTVVLVIEYVMFTWVHDAFDELPYLAFRAADKGVGKSRALDAVGALCYRPLFAGGGSTSAAILRLIDTFGGTLIADEFDQNRNTDLAAALTKILNQGFQRNRPILKCEGDTHAPRAFRCFGPKVFATRQPFGDDATESRTLVIRMEPRTRADIPLNLPRREFDAEALALRNRLLAWRFENLDGVSIDPKLEVPGLQNRLNQIGLPLLSVARTPEVRRQIADALKTQQEEIAADLGETLPGQVFQFLQSRHRPGDVISPKDLARAFSVHDGTTGTRNEVSPEKMGRILTHEFGLRRAPRRSQGTRYHLDPGRMARLSEKYGVSQPEPAQPALEPTLDRTCQPVPG